MMRSTFFWLLAFGGFAAVSLLCGILVWPQLSAAWPSIEEKIDQFRRQPPLAKLVLLLFVGVFVVFGSTKTNSVDQVSGTNEIVRLFGLFDCSIEKVRPVVTPEDIVRGWQLWEVRTNSNVCYTMPEGATMASNWWVRGAFEDCSIVRLGDCSIGGYVSQSNNLNNPNNHTLSFPFGTNEYDSLWAFSWGKMRFELANTNTEIVAVGAPMSAVPYRSRLWSAVDTNGARVVTWENFVLGRAKSGEAESFPLQAGEGASSEAEGIPLLRLVNAQVELRTTGDFIVRSNEIEKVYHCIDDFDWDGDGILNWSDWNPYWYDGDYTGQEDWWREYVDEMVGAGLENGYYKLTATFPQEGFRRTMLTVDWEEIVVAEPGEYVFLLEKGNNYDIDLDPFVDGVAFEAVDDIPAAGGLRMPLMAQAGHWEGRWTKDDGELYLTPPLLGEVGCIIWTPKLRVSPEGWNPSAGDPTETFTAMLFDRTDWITEPTYSWSSANNSVTFGSPSAVTTRATWLMGPQETVSAHLAVSFGDRQLESTLVFRYRDDDAGDPADSESFWMEDMPDTLFINNDNDLRNPEEDFWYFDSGDNDVPCATIRFRSSVPTNGTVRIDNLTGFTGSVYTYHDSSLDEVFAGTTWPIRDSTGEDFQLYFNASGKSRGFDTSQIKVRWIPEVGQEQTFVRRFTVVEPVAEPICTETKRVSVDGEMRDRVYNPCGVVVDRDAYFKIDVKPDAYPDAMITWETSGDGAVQFVGGSHGREVRLRGVAPGDVTLSAKLGNCVSPPPSFTFRVVTNRTIRLSAWIVANKGVKPKTESEVRDMVKVANDIYAQVGVTFDIGDRIVVTNIPAAYDINEAHETEDRWNLGRLTDLATGTGGLECYFVNNIIDDSADARANSLIVGVHTNSGLVVSASGTGITLSHEIGHAFGMRDVYAATSDGADLLDATCWDWQPYDWNGGCFGSGGGRARYYKGDASQCSVIRLMLMDGEKAKLSKGIDITYGDVWGFDIQDVQGHRDTGFFTNARQTENPQHN